MILLDTDILSLLQAGHEKVVARLANVDPAEVLGTTVITLAEVLRARAEFLLKASNGIQLLRAQQRMNQSERLFDDLYVAPIDEESAAMFDKLRGMKTYRKIGRADLLIASIVLTHDATLVSRNLKHFRQIPNLSLANWAD